MIALTASRAGEVSARGVRGASMIRDISMSAIATGEASLGRASPSHAAEASGGKGKSKGEGSVPTHTALHVHMYDYMYARTRARGPCQSHTYPHLPTQPRMQLVQDPPRTIPHHSAPFRSSRRSTSARAVSIRVEDPNDGVAASAE